MIMKYSAIVLAGGSSRRMGTDVKKQFMQLNGKAAIYYPLMAFEKSVVDEVILVIPAGDEGFVRHEIVEEYGFKKVTRIVTGGAERYDSVYNGISSASGEYVMIHDGARSFVTVEIIDRAARAVEEYKACVVGMPSKDTVKISDDEGFVADTPARKSLWVIQTPQAFVRSELLDAYATLRSRTDGFLGITDDSMIIERAGGRRVKLIEGSYDNIKITTPEDIEAGEAILKRMAAVSSKE